MPALGCILLAAALLTVPRALAREQAMAHDPMPQYTDAEMEGLVGDMHQLLSDIMGRAHGAAVMGSSTSAVHNRDLLQSNAQLSEQRSEGAVIATAQQTACKGQDGGTSNGTSGSAGAGCSSDSSGDGGGAGGAAGTPSPTAVLVVISSSLMLASDIASTVGASIALYITQSTAALAAVGLATGGVSAFTAANSFLLSTPDWQSIAASVAGADSGGGDGGAGGSGSSPDVTPDARTNRIQSSLIRSSGNARNAALASSFQSWADNVESGAGALSNIMNGTLRRDLRDLREQLGWGLDLLDGARARAARLLSPTANS